MHIKFHLLTVCALKPSIIKSTAYYATHVRHTTWVDWLWLGIDIVVDSKR